MKISTSELLKANVDQQIEDYIKYSTISTIGSQLQRNKHPLKRFIVICLFNLLFAGCTFVIYDIWKHYLNNPTTMVIELTAEGEPLEFPSIFVCSMEVFNDSALEEFVKKSFTKYKFGGSTANLKSCLLGFINTFIVNNFSFEAQKTDCLEYMELWTSPLLLFDLWDLSYSPKDFFKDCTFKGEPIDCEKEFSVLITEIGYCYSFNSVHGRSYTKQMTESTDKFRRIYQLMEYDDNWSLGFQILEDGMPAQVYLKDSHNLPTLNDAPDLAYVKKLPIDGKFTIIEESSEEKVRRITPSLRGCLFEDEVPTSDAHLIAFFESNGYYNYDMCLYNCHAFEIYKECNCIPNFYSVLFPTILRGYPPCSGENFKCFLARHTTVMDIECENCLKNCNSVTYEVTPVQENEATNIYDLTTQIINQTTIAYQKTIIDLNNWPIYNFKTVVTTGLSELLVSTSGIYGLALGFSFISYIELFYFFTIRFWSALYVNRKLLLKRARAKKEEGPSIDLTLFTKELVLLPKLEP